MVSEALAGPGDEWWGAAVLGCVVIVGSSTRGGAEKLG